MRSLLLLALATSSIAFAQTANNKATAPQISSDSQNFILEFSSRTDSTQYRVFQYTSKLASESKEALKFGYKFDSGWKVFGQVVQWLEVYNQDSPKGTYFAPGDPTISIGHPHLYESKDVKVGGYFRKYFRGGNYVVDHEIDQYAYYSFLDINLSKHNELHNMAIPRYFSMPKFGDSDTTTYFEDDLTFSHKINGTFNIGFGDYSQIENHYKTDTGICSEIYPVIGAALAKGISVEARVYFPVFNQGEVWEGPTNTTFDNVRGEFYFEAGI